MSIRNRIAASLAALTVAGSASIAQDSEQRTSLQPRSGGMNPPMTQTQSVDEQAERTRLAREQLIREMSERQIRVYDLRSMNDVLGGPALRGDRAGVVSRSLAAGTVASLARLVSMQAEIVTDGVYAIAGSAAAHAQFAETLDQLRGLESEHFTVDLRILTITADEPPAIGSTMTTQSGATINHRVLAAVKQRSAVSFAVQTETTYIQGWSPVVSDSAIGYQSNVDEVTSGLEAEVTIDDRLGNGVRIVVRGGVSEADVVVSREPLTGDGLTIGLPIVTTRSFDSVASAMFNTPTVVASMTGFEPGEHLVAVVTVRTLE